MCSARLSRSAIPLELEVLTASTLLLGFLGKESDSVLETVTGTPANYLITNKSIGTVYITIAKDF